MPQLPPHIRTLEPYKAGKPIDEVKRELGLTTVIKLASNENPLGSSPLAVEEMKRCMGNLHLYPNGGYDLRVALAQRYNMKVENVITGSGSEAIMLNLLRTFLCPEDEVLTTEAAFIGFQVLAHASGVRYRTVPYRAWKYDLRAIVRALTPSTKLIYLANPNNPTGTYVTSEEFDAFYRDVPRDVLIIMDEAYFEYAEMVSDYPDSLKYRYDNVVTLRTFSKIYGLAGVRIGYGFAQEDLIGAMLKVKLPFEPSTLAQAAGIGALQDTSFLERSKRENLRGRERMTRELRSLGFNVIPSAANFVMVVFPREEMVDTLFQELLKRGVIIRPLKAFGLPQCVRITIGSEEENTICLAQIKSSIPKVSL